MIIIIVTIVRTVLLELQKQRRSISISSTNIVITIMGLHSNQLFRCINSRVFSPIRERADNLSLMKKTLFLHSFYEITK